MIRFSKKVWLLTITLLFCLSFSTMAQPHVGKLGVEASPSDAFVDVVKGNDYRWDKTDGAGGWIPLTTTDVDANGWPKKDARYIIDYRPATEWSGSIDDPEGYRVNRSGLYKGSFLGQAALTNIEGPFTITNKLYNEPTNTTTFDLTIGAPGPHHGLIVMSFTNTRRTPSDQLGTGISNFKLIRPGYAANTTQVFTNEYISTLTSANFSTLRFMVATITNFEANENGIMDWHPSGTGTTFRKWNDRKRPDDASQGGRILQLNKKQGWSWEYCIDLCNQVDMDMWINIPVSADDDYITQLATLINSRLEPELNIYIEYSNEIWNFGFAQQFWNVARAQELVNAGGSNFNYDGNTDPNIWGQRRHAKRVRDAVILFGNVMGAGQINNRIRGVLAGVSPDPNHFFILGRLTPMLQYLNDNYGAPRNYIYSISIPTYYGGPAASAEEGSGFENASVQQILDNMRATSDASAVPRAQTVALANQYQLIGGFCSYEGGPDIGGGRLTNLANRIAAVRSPAQKDLFKRNLTTNFWDLGGNIAMQFMLHSPYNRWGAWGLTDDITNPDRNALFQGVRELIGNGTPQPDPSGNLAPRGSIISSVTNPQGGGNHDIEIIRDEVKPAQGSTDDLGQFDTFDFNAGSAAEHIGYTFTQSYSFTKLVFQEGKHFGDGGFFENGSLKVQVQQGINWVDVNISPTPLYPVGTAPNQFGQSYQTYTFNLPNVVGTGLRIAGNAGGSNHFISVGELEVYGTVVNTPITTKYEAEDAIRNGGGIATDHPGFSGSGFWAFSHTLGNSIQFTVNAPNAGSTVLTCRYSNGTGTTRSFGLYINGTRIKQSIFTATANWDTWSDQTETITLNTGSNTIEYRYQTGDNGSVNIDYVTIGSSSSRLAAREEPSLIDNSISVYPNPVKSGKLTAIVSSNKQMDATVNLLTTTAQPVVSMQKTLNQGETKIEILTDNLTKGLHFLVIQRGNQRMVKKIMID